MMAPTTTPLGTLAEVAAWAEGRLAAAARPEEVRVTGVSIDTRAVEPGDLFVPLPGQNADGHDFIAEAFRRGAAASLCLDARAEAFLGNEPGPLVRVGDVTAALQRLARRHRNAWSGYLVGITGSSGKTTTKDLVAAALASAYSTLATAGNLNNHWGVPLTLLALRPEHRAAVVEMGSNHPGEIGALAEMARPDAAVITNVGSAHLEHFGTLEAIAREKAALGHAVPREGVTYAGPGDLLRAALAGARCRVVRYGLEGDADFRPLRTQDLGPAGTRIEAEGFPPFTLSLIGRHQAVNVMAALAVARDRALDPERVVAALEAHRPFEGRMEVRRARGAELIVDCYNSNPDSARAALETLSRWPARRRIAVLGDMLELGSRAAELHREVGARVRDAELWTVGESAQYLAAGARVSGTEARVFETQAELAEALVRELAPGVVVLFKASRGAALERVVAALDPEA